MKSSSIPHLAAFRRPAEPTALRPGAEPHMVISLSVRSKVQWTSERLPTPRLNNNQTQEIMRTCLG